MPTTRSTPPALLATLATLSTSTAAAPPPLELPKRWDVSPPLISPAPHDHEPSRAQKDPTVVHHDGRWHVFMTVKLPGRSAIEHVSFTGWQDADAAPRTRLDISDSDYFCAPQVFYFTPHQKWYLIYQMGVPGADKMWVAYSTTPDINDPTSWTRARPALDGGPDDPRTAGGLDYWVICDAHHAYLFLTSLDGKMWRLSTLLNDFPNGFSDCQIALEADVFEASHTYKIKGRNQYLTLIEANGRRHFKAYTADRLDGPWHPLAASENNPFAGAANIHFPPGVPRWTDNISHGELVRASNDQHLVVDPADLRFVFQGMLDTHKPGKNYGHFDWRIGILTPSTDE